MKALRIVGDIDEARRILRTNVTLKSDRLIFGGSEFEMQKLASEHCSIFQVVEVDAQGKMIEQVKDERPKSNKLYKKSSQFKSKRDEMKN